MIVLEGSPSVSAAGDKRRRHKPGKLREDINTGSTLKAREDGREAATVARPKNTKNCGYFGEHKNTNTEAITEYNKKYKEEIEGYKQFAAARRARRKYTQESAARFLDLAKEYVIECEHARQPLTVSGMMLHTDSRKDFWTRAKAGELDYLLEEYIHTHNITDDDIQVIDNMPFHAAIDQQTGEIVQVPLVPWSEILEKTSMLIEDQLEKNCYTNKGNPAGSIFGLKAHYGYRDDPQTPQHLVQNLVIADSEQAKKAMEMLTNVEK